MSGLVNNKVIRDRDFAKRLETACENHSRAPSGHGRQTWLRKQLTEQFELSVSPEAVRKWFAGESRPRPKVMTKIAQLLRVDEAWLSLGMKPLASPNEAAKMSVVATGAVNMVASQIQLAGGTIAYLENNAEYDIFAVIRGVRYQISVRLGENAEPFQVTYPRHSGVSILVMPTSTPTQFRFFRLPAALINEVGKKRGAFVEITLNGTHEGDAIAGITQPIEILDFASLPADETDNLSETE